MFKHLKSYLLSNRWDVKEFLGEMLKNYHLLPDDIYHFVESSLCTDNNHFLGQRWHFVGSFVGPTSTNDVSPMSFCSLGHLNRWFDVGPTPNKPCICQRDANHLLWSIALEQRWPDMIYGYHLLILRVKNIWFSLYFVLLVTTMYSLSVLDWHFVNIYKNKLVN